MSTKTGIESGRGCTEAYVPIATMDGAPSPATLGKLENGLFLSTAEQLRLFSWSPPATQTANHARVVSLSPRAWKLKSPLAAICRLHFA